MWFQRTSARAAFILICTLFVPTQSHVALTYPPARKYDLDFLDNSRTKAPCGMPKGNIKTSILSGAKFNVSWHLGYPHRGGFKIQLLDNLERPVLDLTPATQGSEFVSNDATAQSYQIQLPTNYTCNDCTLRLIRQALEWGNNYKFWSCADVDIKARKEYRETCSGHGRYLLGRCKCDRLYYGNQCQYRDECWENSDCGDHGKCIDVQATTAPRQQCYCELGWFGPGCNKHSPVKSTEIDFGLYTERKLSETFRLYWRIIKEHKELEVVMVVNGTSYAGLGWRPRSLTSSCKNFPSIGPVAQPSDGQANPEPGSEPEPTGEPKSEPEPTSEPKSEPEPKNEPEPTSEPKSEPEPEPSKKAEPELESTTTFRPKYRKSLYTRRSASPSPRVLTSHNKADVVETSVSYKVSAKQGRRKRSPAGEPVAESTSEPEPTQQRDDSNKLKLASTILPNPEPTAEPKSEPEPTSEPKLEPEPTSEPKSEPEPTSEPKSEPEPTSEPKSEPEPTAQPKSEPEPTAEPKFEPEPTAEPKSKPEPTSEPKSVPEPTAEPKAEPEPTAEPKTKPESKLKLKFKIESLAEPKSEPEPNSEPEPTSEPKSEPEPTSEPKTEPEPTSEPKAEPKSKPEPSAEPKSKPEPTAEPKSEPEPSITKTHSSLIDAQPGSKGKAEEPLNPYTPRHDFNPMDCTDIIIGSARNTSSRIADYYTRDRSTPRMDNFWGGKNDLTAAMGFEKDGITTILFRKKLEATEQSDHSIEQGLMHVIWAQGQETGKYVHSPKTGIETSNASVKDFYKADELKYHGHGAQRGVTSINFFDEKRPMTTSEDTSSSRENLPCDGEWKYPRRCNSSNHTCDYIAKWVYFPRRDEIKFTISTKHTDVWTGIGFSNDEKMSQTDAVLGWVDKTGRPFLMDTWITGYTQPFLDASQGIYNTSGKIVDGMTILSFVRKRISNDPKDLSFTNDNCLFMQFPVKGGAFNSVNKKIRKHEALPVVSGERICIHSCGNDDYDDVTTPEPPTLGYNMEVKIVNLGENFHAPEQGSIQYEELSTTIGENFKPVFMKVLGYKKLMVKELKEENNNIIAIMNLQLDKAAVEKGRSLSQTNEQEKNIQLLLQNSVETGRVGALKVDPSHHFVLNSDSFTSNVIPEASQEQNSFFSLSGTKLYIVLGCLAALVLLSVVQAGCTIYRTTKRSSSSHKDHLLHTSAWKDYSSANTNYAFDTLDGDDKQLNGHSRAETLPVKNSSRSGRPQSRPPSVPVYSPNQTPDTRSLQRPRSYQPSNTSQLERSTLSLPRTSYDRHNRPPPDMQPDFYFMPSQRKYSGEVVRVYVDYNNKPK